MSFCAAQNISFWKLNIFILLFYSQIKLRKVFVFTLGRIIIRSIMERKPEVIIIIKKFYLYVSLLNLNIIEKVHL